MAATAGTVVNNHNCISVQDIDTVFACMVGFSGSAISNMPSKFSREPRELPWQPNLDKINYSVEYPGRAFSMHCSGRRLLTGGRPEQSDETFTSRSSR